MEKNYYEILEINKNASKEIMDKAYKTLIKKYHPDLQQNNLKEKYEEKIKIINEAYEILSNSQKRAEYDLTLKNPEISQTDYNNLKQENTNLKNQINYLKNNYNKYNYSKTKNIQNNNHEANNPQDYKDAINEAIRNAYYDAYINNLKAQGCKIKYKKTIKDYLSIFLTIIIFIILFVIFWNIPPIKNYFISLYNDNFIIRFIINIFINFKNSIFQKNG